MGHVLPNFLHAGAPKAASGWLWRVCKEHPEIYVPQTPDNVNFFTVHYHRGLDWYERTYFADVGGRKAVGEFSNSYMMFEPALHRIARDLPDARLTLTLRNPIERAWLQWAHIHLKKKYGLDPDQGRQIPFERALHHHGHQWFRMWIEAGMYALHLGRIWRLFPRERVLVTFYDDLAADNAGYVRRYFEWLGVDPGFRPSLIGVVANPDRGSIDGPHGLKPEVREELRQVYREDIRRLQDMVGRDLSHWQ
jgi:hypothetical protein